MPRWLAIFALTAWLSGDVFASDLVGRIWAPERGGFVKPAEVERAVASARYILLGEQHPVAGHHRLQARLLRAAAKQRRPAVVFEMIPATHQPAIDAWRRTPDPAAADLGPVVTWAERGWPDWRIYLPIVQVALERGLPLVAGGPSSGRLQSVARSGLEGLDARERRALGLDRPLPQAGRERLLGTLRAMHCGETHVPLERMLAVQRLRDAAMAERLRAHAAEHDGAALIAGHGHVRKDYGVPRYLGAEEAETIAIAFRTANGTEAVEEHVAAPGGALAYDYVWFTAGGASGPRCGES